MPPWAAMLYWVSNPLWLGGTFAVGAIAAIKLFWFGSLSYQFGGNAATDAVVEILIALFFVWGTIWCAILSLRVGKYLSVFGSYLKLGLLVVFVLLAMLFLFGGHSQGGSLNFADLVPTNFGMIVSFIIPVLIFQWQGFEVQNGAGEEMANPQRDVPRSIIRAGAVAVVAYAAFLITILLVLPKDQLSNVGSFLAAFKAVDVVLGPLATPVGWLVALAFAVALASSGGTWIMGADRTYAISALDRTAPLIFGRFSGKVWHPYRCQPHVWHHGDDSDGGGDFGHHICLWRALPHFSPGAWFCHLHGDDRVPVHLPVVPDPALQISPMCPVSIGYLEGCLWHGL